MAEKQDTIHEILQQKQASEDYLRMKRLTWDSAEMLFHNQLNDKASSKTRSQVFDPKLANLTIERSYRVMAQLQAGKVRGISKNDIGDATLKNLILEKYVIPNANAQFDFLTKMRMVDLYSNIYGNFFVLIDWDIKPNGYKGPDVWLLNIRDVFPQVGSVSLEDSDYVIVRTWRPYSFFESKKGDNDFKNIDKLLVKLKGKSGSKQDRDSNNQSKREDRVYPEQSPANEKGYFEVLTKYERKTWTDYCVDADMVFRERDNPHDDNDLPVKCKYSIPLLDDFMGMSDFERGGSMQKMVNSIWNLYGDAVKMSIYPPILVNKDNIASMSSIKQIAAAKWLVRGNSINNTAQPVNLTPQGIATFNNTYQVATAAILGIFGSTETNTTQQTDPGYGKTPQALKMQSARENTRDNADRFFMEQFLTSVMKKFCNLLSKKQSSAITLRLFKDEIESIARSYPEVKDSYDEKTGKLTVKKGSGSELYDYEIVSGSTYAVDQQQQQQNLAALLQMFQSAQTPQGNMLVETLKQEGYDFKFGELLKRIVSSSGIQDWDKILVELTPEEQGNQVLDAHAQQFQQALNQMQGSINQTPAMPQDPSMQQSQGAPMPQGGMQGMPQPQVNQGL